MSILRTKRKSGRTVYHEWDYELQDSKILLVQDLDLVHNKSARVEKIWIKPNLNIGANKCNVNYFFSNYEIDTTGRIINVDQFSEHYMREKQATLRKDVYYVNLERVYEYVENGRTKYGYFKQQYPVALLVAVNFLENPDPTRFKYISFKDGNRGNHNLANLIWTDKKNKKTLKILR